MTTYTGSGTEVFANDALGTVTSGGTDAPAAGTVQTWLVTQVNPFAAASSSATPPAFFYGADADEDDESEKVLVTNISGSTWTVTRGADGTTPVAHASGWSIVQVAARATYEGLAGLPPSGDTSGATDYANITAALAGGLVAVKLQPGAFYISDTIIVPSGCSLTGAFPVQADSNSSYQAGPLSLMGTVIHAAGAFTGDSPPAAMIECSNTTDTQEGGQVIANLSLEGNTTPSGSGVFGILLHGAVGAGIISGVVVHRTDGPLLRVQKDSGTGYSPDQWRVENSVFAASRSSHGVMVDSAPDFDWIDCLSHNNALDGWNVGSGSNSNWLGCRGENNAGSGFHFTGFYGAGVELSMNGCSTQANDGNGWLFDATGTSNAGTYLLTGCRSSADGQTASGILAGFYDDGSASAVMLTGCAAIKNSTGPAYGAYEGSTAFGMALAGCRMQGVTAATHDDGTNTNVLSNLAAVPF